MADHLAHPAMDDYQSMNFEFPNKNIKKIVQKMAMMYKDWHEMFPFSLHGYRTSARTLIGVTPYSLVYSMDAVLPIEVQIPSLRIMKDAGLSEDDWIQTWLDQLNLIDDKKTYCYLSWSDVPKTDDQCI